MAYNGLIQRAEAWCQFFRQPRPDWAVRRRHDAARCLGLAAWAARAERAPLWVADSHRHV